MFLWVLLVPAGWSDAARQMMSEAAITAGLSSEGSEPTRVAAILFEQQEEFHLANPPTFEQCQLVAICENIRTDTTVQRITKRSDDTIVIQE